MSHSISDLAVVPLFGDAPQYAEKSVYEFPVVFVKKPDGDMTWRGVGQYLPAGEPAGIGFIGFVGDNDGSWGPSDEWPLEILPAYVLVDNELYEHWPEIQWDDHDVHWAHNSQGRLMAAQYCRAK